MAAQIMDREAILRLVRAWPVNEQVALADAILADARSTNHPMFQPPTVPSSALRGMLSNGQPAPSDEEVEHILEEERWKKYGDQ